MKLLPRRTLAVFLLGAALAACSPDPLTRVNRVVLERTGHDVKWNRHAADDSAIGEAVRGLLSRELSADAAVQIAFLNNPGLQARLEELGIAEADLVQAGLLRNPVFAASWRFPDRGPRQTDAEYSVTAEFLDLLMIPLRKQLAQQALWRMESSIAHDVLALAADVKAAFYQVQARQAEMEMLQTLVEIEDAGASLAQAQHDAGTLNDLALARYQAALAEARRRLLRGRGLLVTERETLNRLLGLWGADTVWKAESPMPDLPAEEVPLEQLEARSLANRMDYAAARQSLETMGRALGISEDFRYLASIKIGVDTEREPGGPNLTGPTLELELPIFDDGSARLAVLRGRYLQARQELIRMAIDIRSETREARDRLILQREMALLQRGTLVPLRSRIVELTQLHANTMVQGPYDLLAAKREEVLAQRDAVDALRDYWIARVQLERAVGGRLGTSATEPMPDSTVPRTAPAPSVHLHDSHGDMP